MKRIIVLAGNHMQFQKFLRTNFDTAKRRGELLTYADHPDTIKGLEVYGVEIVGSFWERQDARKLHEEAMARLQIPKSKVVETK